MCHYINSICMPSHPARAWLICHAILAKPDWYAMLSWPSLTDVPCYPGQAWLMCHVILSKPDWYGMVSCLSHWYAMVSWPSLTDMPWYPVSLICHDIPLRPDWYAIKCCPSQTYACVMISCLSLTGMPWYPTQAWYVISDPNLPDMLIFWPPDWHVVTMPNYTLHLHCVPASWRQGYDVTQLLLFGNVSMLLPIAFLLLPTHIVHHFRYDYYGTQLVSRCWCP